MNLVRIHGGGEAPVKRTMFRLLDLALAIGLSLAIASVGQLRAAKWPNIRESDTLRPGASVGDPQRPTISDAELAQIDASPRTNSLAF